MASGRIDAFVLVPPHAAGGAARKHRAVRGIGESDVDAAALTFADDAIGADDMQPRIEPSIMAGDLMAVFVGTGAVVADR